MSFKEFTTKNFLGRNSEIEGLQGIAAEAAFGDANSLLVYGKRGVGKTELLKHLYNRLFSQQNDSIPFFYTLKTSFTSIEDFSKDYLRSFILQGLAFLNKDIALTHSGRYSLDDLIYIAHKADAQWAVQIIDQYLQLREEGKPIHMLSHAMSAPYISYRNTDRAVVVMIDDFHKIGKFCELNMEEGRGSLSMVLDSTVSSRHTPHIISGCQSELQKMFFEETSIGNNVELMNLQRLASHESELLFKLLGEIHSVNIDLDPGRFINVLNGNPFYIKSFMQSARQSCRTLTEEDFWQIYLNEVMKGKIFTYWTSLLKSYVPPFELRKPSLSFLYNLSREDMAPDFSALSEQLSIDSGNLDRIINMLQSAGTIESGFSTFGIADDAVFMDVIRGLYYTEIERQPVSRVRELILDYRNEQPKTASPPSFDLSIPATPKAELFAVKSLEQAALFYKIPLEYVGEIQIALIELFSGSLAQSESSSDKYDLKFNYRDNVFSTAIITSQPDISMLSEVNDHIRAYVDDLKVEKIMNGTRIVLLKEIKGNLVSAS